MIRERQGHLHRLHRGVYAVGHPNPPLPGRFLAATLACEGILSHVSAAAHYGIVRWDGRFPEVTVTRTNTRRHPGIRVHRTTTLAAQDITRHQGIPTTSPTRTLFDLAATFTEKALKRAIREAVGHRLTSIPALVAAIDRNPPRRTMADVLADAAPTRSELEDVVLELIRGAGLAEPDVNVTLHGFVPDFRWPAQRLIVEADGRDWHDNPLARRDDRERQRLLEARGETVVRVTWTQAVRHRADFIAALASAGAPVADRGPRPKSLTPGLNSLPR